MKYQRLHDLRIDRDLKQENLAAYLNVNQPTYSKYERGELPLTAELLIMLADFYDVSVDYILGRSDIKKR